MFEVRLPQTSEDDLESVIVFWHKSEGDTVNEGDVLVEVQTEKAVFEIEAEESGVLYEIRVPRGEVAGVGQVLATIAPSASTPIEKIDQQEKVESTEQSSESSQFVKVSPRIRRLARDLGVDLAIVKGTGRNGHITEEDLHQAVKQESRPDFKSVPIVGVRKTIAKRMSESLVSTAQLTETAWADVTLLAEERSHRIDKVSWNDLLLFAVAKSLKQNPNINAHVFEEEIRQYEKVHLGVAVDTEDGLYVPVIKNADELSLLQLRDRVRELVEKVSQHRITPEELSGGTFTVTNLGSFGIQFFTPILNLPEAAILGVGKIETDLTLKNGQITERKRLPLSLTFDHRAIDGAPAAKFIQTLIGYLEEPARLLDEVLAK
ncbi:2-oxo acid dehydrogenase subunit E2 [Neobacillus cucumis]|uniref:dihydrolipoamide acetyltransferase family protein n=1 Tax=Neobacillus cucumis TaxID=1740721 RepID=UPI0018E036A2|nr:dihydrolipoamide acetyltransferase family protein [Neobacillus cucumis]MBI0578577.1 2-oxo acid dehydrogenase subunit E2 [Neobacillus cucumis]